MFSTGISDIVRGVSVLIYFLVIHFRSLADVTSSSTHHGRHGILTTHRCRAGIPSDVPYTAFDIQKDDSHTERSGTYVCGSASAQRLSRSSTRTDLAKMPNARLESLGRNIFAI